MKKKISRAFGKDVYLLGKDKDGYTVWLEAPVFDCGWYWAFGYVERYTNKLYPSNAKDIISHTHIDSEFKKGDVINVRKGLDSYTFSLDEGKRLSDLFTTFYTLRKESDSVHKKDEKRYKELNDKLIPEVMNQIIEILTPTIV